MLAVVMDKKTVGSGFTVEWHEITKQTYDTIKPTFELLQPIFVAALLP